LKLTQRGLAAKLVAKLGFVRDKKPASVLKLGSTNPFKPPRRRKSRASVELTPPDNIIFCPRLLRFNLGDPHVYPEQLLKLREETGLTYQLLKDLEECSLDAEVAKLLYYCYRVSWITSRNGTIENLCGYLPAAKGALKADSPTKAFWSGLRLKYRRDLRLLIQTIKEQKSLALTDKTRKCIDDFLTYIHEGWGID
jgi:hypothetical protein